MKFAHPSILYALFFLLIPVIIHLVRWKRFQTQWFTNVDFLQDLEIQSRKSRRLKELIILLLRMLVFAALVLAFAGPFFPSKAHQKGVNSAKNMIYVDNSLSLTALKGQTTLWQSYLQDLKQNLSPDSRYTLLTNNHSYPDLSFDRLQQILPKLSFSVKPANHRLNFKKIALLLSGDDSTLNNILYCSDLQDVYKQGFADSLLPKVNTYFLVHQQKDIKNISIDSIWIAQNNLGKQTFKLKLSATHKDLQSPVTITSGDKVLWRSYVNFKDSLEQSFSFVLPQKEQLSAQVNIQDKGFLFDNTLYFTLPEKQPVKVLVVGKEIPSFLSKIYTDDAFKMDLSQANKLDASRLSEYDVIVLNGTQIPSTYYDAFQQFVKQYGNMIILPGIDEQASLTQLLQALHIKTTVSIDTNKVFLNKINYKHPLFKNVFTRAVQNFAYPYIKKHYRFSRKGSWLYNLSDGSAFAQVFYQKAKIFVINTPLQADNTNFTDAGSLIVPLFYQMGKDGVHNETLYHVLGKNNRISVPVKAQPDQVLHLVNKEVDFIPLQENHYNRILLQLQDQPEKAGIYKAVYNGKEVGMLAFNDDRIENSTYFLSLPKGKNIIPIQSVKDFTLAKQAFFKAQNIWQWFLIAALFFLLLEMLLLRYWKA